jgi:hypothetical protein
MSGPEDRLDRRFVVTAALLAAVYAFLVAIIAATIGKEAAGAAGVGLFMPSGIPSWLKVRREVVGL